MKSNFFKNDLVNGNGKLKTKAECLELFATTPNDKGYAKSSDTILLKALGSEGQFSTGIAEYIAIPHIRDDVMKNQLYYLLK